VYFETQRWIIEKLFGVRGYEVEWQKFDAVYDEGSTSIICVEGRSVGWLSTTSRDDAIEIGHIYLLPMFQRRGIGTLLIQAIIGDARAAGLRVRLSTAKINPAVALYKRLGFQLVGESEFKIYMELR
jgi:ribosomal protein S18 acetylase RimI-like enzyme